MGNPLRKPRDSVKRTALASRVAAFLTFHQSHDFCDDCVASQVGVASQEVKATVLELAKSPVFLRDRWQCSICGKGTVVSRALPNRTVATRISLRTRVRRRTVPIRTEDQKRAEGA